MRAFLNVIFFVLILFCGLVGGYIYARSGLTLPHLTDRLDLFVQNRLGISTSIKQISANLDAQQKISQQLDRALRTTRQEVSELENRNRQLSSALNQLQATSSANGGRTVASRAALDELIEQNQFLTEELTRLMNQAADLEARLAAARSVNANPVNANPAEGTGSQGPQSQQQFASMVAERRQLMQTLNKTLQQRDATVTEFRTLQSRFQTLLGLLKSDGIDVDKFLGGAGIDPADLDLEVAPTR